MCLRSFLPINLFKSTQRERQNLYKPTLAPNAWLPRGSGDVATALYENAVTARHPTAPRYKDIIECEDHNVRAFRNMLAQKVHMAVQFS